MWPAAEVGGKIYSSLLIALNAAQDGDTVKLLANHVTDWSDVDAGDSTLAVVTKKLTLDLCGKSMDWLEVGEMVSDEEGGILDSTDGNLTVVDSTDASRGTIQNLAFKKGTLNIQGGEIGRAVDGSISGKLTCGENSGSVTISDGAVLALTVGEGSSVTVSGGSGHNGYWFNDGTLNITGGTFRTVDFLNNGGTIAIRGGTFGTIKNNGASTILPAMELLEEGYAFYDMYEPYEVKDGSRSDYLTNVTVKSHDHTIENGKCACGAAFVASVKSGENVSYYTTLQSAFDNAQDYAVITLLADVQLITPLSIEADDSNPGRNYLTLDLNGKTISCENWQYSYTVFTEITFTICDSSSEKTGAITNGRSYAVWASAGALTITGGIFGSVVIYSDAEISGGTFSKIKTCDFEANPVKLNTVLMDGYAFADSDGSIVNGYEKTNAQNVTVVEHAPHTYDADGKCTCGAEQTKEITSVTVDGLNVTYDVTGNQKTEAGEYQLTVTGTNNFTGSVMADYSIAAKDITNAAIKLGKALTYNGKLQTQSITSVTVDGLTVTYDVTGDKATNAGDYTLTVTANGNFAGTLTADYTVAQKDIQHAVVDVESPVYTGKIQSPKINSVTVDDMILVEGTDYTALTRDAVSAGSYAMKLIGMGNFTGTADRTFAVLKAEALTVEPIRIDVTNDYAASYTVALRTALNGVLPEGCSFGTVNYGSPSISDPSGYCENAAIRQDILTLAVAQVSSDAEGLVATVEIPVETANYQQMTVTVELYAVNKLIPTGAPTPSKTTLNYGDALSSIRLRGSMRSGGVKVPGTFSWAEPDLRPAAGEYEATWVFTPNDSKYAAVTGTITITVKEPSQPIYKVGGVVKGFRVVDNEELAPISGAVVTICKGLTVLGGRKLTDESGLFDLDGVLPGVYNVVVEYQGKTVTTKVELTDHDVELKVLLPEEDVNSELEIRNAGSLTRNAVVGGLDEEASLRFTKDGTLDGGSVLVSMEIREQPADKNSEVQKAIRQALKTRELEFVDLTLTLVKNGVETNLPESGTVLEIILSCDANRKLVIARQEVDENGQITVKQLTESDTGAEGTYYIDKAIKRIHLFVSRLSTYAIGYYGTTGSGGGSGSTDASGTTPDGVKSANTGDIGLLPYAVMALSACTGVTVLRFRRKRED